MIAARGRTPFEQAVNNGAYGPWGVPQAAPQPQPTGDVWETARAPLPDLSNRIDPQTGEIGWTNTGIKGVGQRFGDWLRSPGTAGALLRGAAASFRGEGIGGAIDAGAGYMDQRQQRETAAEQQAFSNDLALRGADLAELRQQQANHLGWAGVTNDALRIDETGRHNRTTEGLTASDQRLDAWKAQVDADLKRQGIQVDWARIGEQRAGRLDTNARHDRPSASTVYSTDAANYRAGQAAGIGSRGHTETRTETPGMPERDAPGLFTGNLPATPKTVTTTRTPIAPGGSEIRYDAQGNAYRRDPATGKPVRVQP